MGTIRKYSCSVSERTRGENVCKELYIGKSFVNMPSEFGSGFFFF